MKLYNKIKGDVFKILTDGDVLCIPTNGIVMHRGEAVMGGGFALLMKKRYPSLPKILGKKLTAGGNHCYVLGVFDFPVAKNVTVVSFPTKNHFSEKSSVALIEQSSKELVDLASCNGWSKVYVPAPGLGLGGLTWEDIQDSVSVMDDRFSIIEFSSSQ